MLGDKPLQGSTERMCVMGLNSITACNYMYIVIHKVVSKNLIFNDMQSSPPHCYF